MSSLRRAFYAGLFQGVAMTPDNPSVPASYVNPVPVVYDPPVTISAGGTYTGNWESTVNGTPAVTITTADPVILLNCNIRSRGYLIQVTASGANVKVLNTRGYGTSPSEYVRRFLLAENVKNIVVEHCYLESTAGIYLAGNYQGNSTTDETIRVRYNQAINIDGRTFSGAYAYQAVQFFQTNTVRKSTFTTVGGVNYYDGVPNMEVRWNSIHNRPGQAHVEDNINIYNTRGTASSLMRIEDNLVRGAFYWDWQGENFTGSGMITDSPGANKGNCTAYVNFVRNTVIGSNNNDYGVAGGTHINFVENVGLNKGYIDAIDAERLGLTPVSSQTEYRGYAGNIYVHSNYVEGVTSNISEVNHVEGIHGEKTFTVGNRWRNDGDLWSSSFGTITNRTTLAGMITEATEQQYITAWENRRTASNITVGVTA